MFEINVEKIVEKLELCKSYFSLFWLIYMGDEYIVFSKIYLNYIRKYCNVNISYIDRSKVLFVRWVSLRPEFLPTLVISEFNIELLLNHPKLHLALIHCSYNQSKREYSEERKHKCKTQKYDAVIKANTSQQN